MTQETNFRKCFVNGKNAGVATYSGGDFSAALLFFCTSLGAGDIDIIAVQKSVIAAGGKLSLHQFNNAWQLSSGDEAGIKAIIPGASIVWENTPEYEEEERRRKGTRGGKKDDNKPVASAAPAVAASGAFAVPSVDGELKNILALMPVLAPTVEEWGAAVAALTLAGEECLPVPENVTSAAALIPSLGAAVEIYKNTVIRAAKEYKDQKEREEREREEKEKALEAARAAANGKTLVSLPDCSTVEVEGRVHNVFIDVAQLLKTGSHVYLHGPAGTGKTYLAKQAAAALGLEYFSDQKVANEYQLTGFVNAAGEFVETELYRAIKAGGLYLLDEIDASDPNAVTALNSALANGYITFAGAGRVEIPETFRVIATGNTIGRGASMEYCGRNPLDLATLDRFEFVGVEYDSEIELQKAKGNKEIVEFIHSVRLAAKNNGVAILASLRSIDAIARLDGLFPEIKILNMALLKGLEKDQISLLADGVPAVCRWSKALHELAA